MDSSAWVSERKQLGPLRNRTRRNSTRMGHASRQGVCPCHSWSGESPLHGIRGKNGGGLVVSRCLPWRRYARGTPRPSLSSLSEFWCEDRGKNNRSHERDL